jgi:hypothetical protein
LTGTLIRLVSAPLMGPVRTAFHDAVARFGGFGTASASVFFSSRKQSLPRHL